MNRRALAVIFLLAAFVAIALGWRGVAREAIDGWRNRVARVSVDGSVLRIEGRLTANTADEVARQNLDAVRSINVASIGGDVDAAISIARLVHQRGWSVAVDDHCLNECALYVFAAAASKEMTGDALVGCGANVEALTLVANAVTRTHSQRAIARAQAIAREARELGIPEGFALNCLNGVVPLCYRAPGDGDAPYTAQTLARLWLPIGESFRVMGVNNVVGAPTSRADIQRIFYVGLLSQDDWDAPTALNSDFLRRELVTFARACS